MRLFLLGGLSAAVLTALPARSQDSRSRPPLSLSLGLTAGPGIPFTPMNPDRVQIGSSSYVLTRGTAKLFSNGRAKEGYSLGLFARTASGRWFAQPEVGYQYLLSSPISYQPPPTSLSSSFIGTAQNHNFEAGQVSLGLLIGAYLESGHHLYIVAGPAISFRVAGSNYDSTQPTAFGRELCESLNQAPEATRYYLNGGIGYWGLAQHLNVEARFGYGLTPLVRRFRFRGQDYPLEAQAHLLLLTVGYSLRLRK